MTIRTDVGVVHVATRIDDHMRAIADLIDRVRESKHPHAQQIADALNEQCYAPAWAEHVVHEKLEHPEQWETGNYGIRRKKEGSTRGT